MTTQAHTEQLALKSTIKFLAVGSKLKQNALILNLWRFPPIPVVSSPLLYPTRLYAPPDHLRNLSLSEQMVYSEIVSKSGNKKKQWRKRWEMEGRMQRERTNGRFWIATDGWRTNQEKLQRAWERRALLIQLAGDSGYLAARGPVLTCRQALMAIFWVLPTVTHPKRGQQDRKRKLLQHSRNLSNLSLHPLCFPSLSWGAKHVPACPSPSVEVLGPKD